MGERPPKRTEWAAGGVVRRDERTEEPSYLVVHRPRYDDWSLPKGHVDDDELLVEAAIREVREETGVAAVVDRLVGTVSYDAGTVRKVVRWWSMMGDGEFTPNGEVDERRWLPHAEASTLLSYRADRNVLARAHAAYATPGSGRIFLLRHATAGNRSRWQAPDRTRPLDARGVAQALRLRDELALHPITRIVSSGYARCTQSVAPLAKALGLALETDPALEEHQGPEAAVALIRDLRGESAVLSSHGDIIGALVGAFAAEGMCLDGELRWEKGSVWIVDTVDGRPVAATYLPPPA